MLSYFPAAGLDLIYDRVRLNCLETRTDAIRSLQQGTLLKSADISLWTDGAWNQTRGGAGAVLLDNTILTPIRIYRQTIQNCHSSYQAEAHAFAGGLQMLHRFLQAHPATNSVSIYTDSRSLVTAIQAALIKAKPIGAGLFNSLSGLWEVAKLPDIAISLTWVPGHTGILGNEMADSLASTALVEPYSPRILLTPFSTLRLVFRKKRNGELRYYLRSSVQKSSNPRHPPRDTWLTPRSEVSKLACRMTIQLFRLRTEHSLLLDHRKYIRWSQSARCRYCQACHETADHIFSECAHFADQLKHFRSWLALRLPILTENGFHNLLQSKEEESEQAFAEAIGCLNKNSLRF